MESFHLRTRTVLFVGLPDAFFLSYLFDFFRVASFMHKNGCLILQQQNSNVEDTDTFDDSQC